MKRSATGTRLFLSACVLALAAAGCRWAAPQGVYDGIIELEQRELGFELPGRISQVLIQRGDRVAAGQLLAKMDDTLDRAQYAVLQAQLTSAKSQMEFTEKELARELALLKSGSIGQAQVDQAETQARQAGAAFEVAKAQIAALEEKLAHYELKAPADAVVLDVASKTGEVVPAAAAAIVVALTRLPYVDVFVPVPDVANLKTGGQVQVRPDGAESDFKGTIESISATTEFTPRYLLSEADRGALVTRVRVRIEDPEERIHGGIPCRVTFGGSRRP